MTSQKYAFVQDSGQTAPALSNPSAKNSKKGMREMLSETQHGRRIWNAAWKIVLSLMIVLAFVAIGSYKAGYHIDEMYTLGLSNSALFPKIEDGTVYASRQLWQEYAMASEDRRFDYGSVVENQSHDVHPPLYYALIHTVFSLFPGTYSIWYPMSVNIGLAIIVFWQMVWLFRFFTEKRTLSVLFSLLFIFTMGFVNNVVFFRMYVLLALWTNALTMLFCKYRPGDAGWKYYALLVFILTGGTMTQYYFIIFAFFARAVYAVRVLMAKNWKKLALSCVSAALSLGLSTLIFPPMWKHIFKSYRGRESFANLSADGFCDFLHTYLDFVNLEIFGSLFVFLLLLGIALFVLGSKDFKRENTKDTVCNWLQLVIPALCYILVVAKIAPFRRDRYVMNVMGIVYLSVFAALVRMAFWRSRKAAAGIMAVALLTLFCSYQKGTPNLHSSVGKNREIVNKLGENVPCLCLYDASVKVLPNYIEMENLGEIVFIGKGNIKLLENEAYRKYDSVLVYSTLNDDRIIDQLLDQNPGLSKSRKLFESSYAAAYFLE